MPTFIKTQYIVIQMAVIQTIRDKYAKVAGGVIVLALVGFVLMDASSGGGGGLFSGNKDKVGVINGETIKVDEYEREIQKFEQQRKMQNPNYSSDEQSSAQMRDQVWNQMVTERLNQDIYDKLGITVSKQELEDLLVGPNPDPAIVREFTNPETGQFDAQTASANIQRARRDPQMKAQWEAFENDLVQRRYSAKLNAMISGAFYAPKFILDQNNQAQNEVADISYVSLPYTLVPDSEAKVTDDEINQYIKENKVRFRQKEAVRNIEYVTFDVVPSAEDSNLVLEDLATIREEYAVLSDGEDLNLFITQHSETPRIGYFTEQQLGAIPVKDELWSASLNQVVGPYYDGSAMVLSKVVERKTFPDSAKVRHILVKTEDRRQVVRTEEEAKARLDSAIALLKSGVPFDTIVSQFTDDDGSKGTGGEYTFTLNDKPNISKEFADFTFEGSTGQNKTVQVSNDAYAGYHYIEILEQKNFKPAIKVASINKSLFASEATYTNVYSQATKFAADAKNAEAFNKAAQENMLTISPAGNINKNSSIVSGLGASRELVKWTYKAKVGDVSDIFSIGDKYVIAKLKDVAEAGVITINEDNRAYLESMVMKAKKAKILMEKNKSHTSLEAIATANTQEVGVADSITMNQGYIPGLGGEAKVSGYVFNKNFKENTLSPAIVGSNAVYFVSVRNRRTVSPDQPRNLEMERKLAESQFKASAANAVMNSLKELYEVKDTRGEVY